MKKIILLLICIANLSVFSQADSLRKMVYAGVNFHMIINTPIFGDQNSFNSISLSENSILNKSIVNYKLNNFGYSSDLSPGGDFFCGLRLIPKHKNCITRFSAGIEQNHFMQANYANDSSNLIGHVTATNSTYNSYYLVKKKYSSVNYNSSITNLGVSAAQLFYSNREKYFSVYAGLAFSANASIKSSIEAYSNVSVYTYKVDSITGKETFAAYNSSESSFENTTSKAKLFAYLGVGVPVGAELRFAKKRKRLKHISCAFEVIPQVNYIISPSLSRQTHFTYRVTPLNLIYRF